MTEGLVHPHPDVRKDAAILLGTFQEKAKNALPFLVTMQTSDPVEACRRQAARAIDAIVEKVL